MISDIITDQTQHNKKNTSTKTCFFRGLIRVYAMFTKADPELNPGLCKVLLE